MTPSEFPEQNVVLARDQNEYQPLPAYQDDKYTVSCWKMTLWDRIVCLFTGRVWLMLMHFGEPVQPSMIVTKYPFESPVTSDRLVK